MSPFDPNGTGAYVPVSRVKPITADFVGDATKGGASNIQEFMDARRALKEPCRVLALIEQLPPYQRDGNIITGTGNLSLNTAGIDGVINLRVNDRILVNAVTPQELTQAKDCGIYVITALGSASTPFQLMRAFDANTTAEMRGNALIWVLEGTEWRNTLWKQDYIDSSTWQLNIDILNFTPMSIAGTGGGTGLTPEDRAFIDSRQDVKVACDVATVYPLDCTYDAGQNTLTSNVDGLLRDLAEKAITGGEGIDSGGRTNTVAINSRVLVRAQTALTQNGIYVVQDSGGPNSRFVLRRAADAPTAADNKGVVFIKTGALFGGTFLQLSSSGGEVITERISVKDSLVHPMASYLVEANLPVTITDVSNLVLEANSEGPLTITSGSTTYTPPVGSTVFLRGQAQLLQNGLFNVANVGSATEKFKLVRTARLRDLNGFVSVFLPEQQLFYVFSTENSFLSYPITTTATGGSDASSLNGIAASEYALKPEVLRGSYQGAINLDIVDRDYILILRRDNIDPSTEPLTVYLPENGFDGQRVTIKDQIGAFDQYSVIVKGQTTLNGVPIENPRKVEGQSEIRLQTPFMSVTFVKAVDWWII